MGILAYFVRRGTASAKYIRREVLEGTTGIAPKFAEIR
jgi:hypothetical protein